MSQNCTKIQSFSTFHERISSTVCLEAQSSQSISSDLSTETLNSTTTEQCVKYYYITAVECRYCCAVFGIIILLVCLSNRVR